MMKTTFQIACALAFCTAAGGAFAGVRYECQTMQAGSYVFAATTAINSAGEVVGYSDFPTNGRNATRWAVNGDATELGDFGSDAYGTGINDNGQVVGHAWVPDWGYVPVAWNGTTPTALGLLPGDTAGYARDVNNRGVIVGNSRSGMYGRSHAVMWRNGKVIDLGALGDQADQASRSSSASEINRGGDVVGSSETGTPDSVHAVWWDASRQIHDLGTLAGAQKSWASAINDQGVIVGYSERAAGDKWVHAVAWVDGAMRDLGVLPGHKQSRASAVNRSGTVVGTGTADDTFFHTTALVWPGLGRAPRDLNKLLTNPCVANFSTYTLTAAAGVNRDGAIAATGEYIDGLGGVHYGAFKLVPVPAADAAQ